jgi:hypothetical protein
MGTDNGTGDSGSAAEARRAMEERRLSPVGWLGARKRRRREAGERVGVRWSGVTAVLTERMAELAEGGSRPSMDDLLADPGLARDVFAEVLDGLAGMGCVLLCRDASGRETYELTWGGRLEMGEEEAGGPVDYRYAAEAVWRVAWRLGRFSFVDLREALVADRRERILAGGRPARPSLSAAGLMVKRWIAEGRLEEDPSAERRFRVAPGQPPELPPPPPPRPRGRPKGRAAK